MPCYDPQHNHSQSTRTEYVNRPYPVDNPKDKALIIQLEDKVKNLEAGLCAVFSELERKGIANEIISQASKSGLINLMDFWLKHSEEDETRISRALHHFSEHEQILMKKILNKNTKL